jgi:protocatechuate 3,4-dioxygenase beta subunit
MRNMTERELTDVVLERYEATPDARLRTILQSLIRHLHAFARDVRLTEAEWMAGIKFLTATGNISDEKRQEMILLSDNLGLSSLVNMLTADVPEGATETTVLGPFYVPNSPKRAWGESILLRESKEPPLFIHGRVRTDSGEAIPGAKIEVWQTDSNGMYDIQDSSQPEDNLRGYYTAADDGTFLIRTIRPTSYPIPTDGPVGALLRATKRHPYRPAHVHAIVTAPGYRTLTTHLFDSEDGYLDSDVVFAVKQSLIRSFVWNESAADAAKYGAEGPFWELTNDFVLTKAA